MKCD